MRPADAERVHRREHRRSEIVAGRVFGHRAAVAVAGIVEGERAPAEAEMIELRVPDGLVGADPVQEKDRHAAAAALRDADAPARSLDAAHSARSVRPAARHFKSSR